MSDIDAVMGLVRSAVRGPFGNSPKGRHNAKVVRAAIESYGQERADEAVASLPCQWFAPSGITCAEHNALPSPPRLSADVYPCATCTARKRLSEAQGKREGEK